MIKIGIGKHENLRDIKMKTRLNLPALILIVISAGLLSAQNLDEDKLLLQQYTLPEQALVDSVLTEIDSVMYLKSKPFTGTAYSLYDNGRLQHASPYIDGLKHGTTFVWYPDGKPQLIANYRNGYLNGRFKGWYQFGAVIYDLMMKDSSLAGDQMYETDAARETATTTDSEPSSDGIEQGND